MDPRNFKIEDVTLNYARLDRTVSPFGSPQFEFQIATTDQAKVAMLETNHIMFRRNPDGTLKTNPDGEFFASLKRKAVKADGSDNGPVRVVNADTTPFPADKMGRIGNGSRGNVIVFQYPWEQAGRKGIASSLTAVQVTEFKEFVPTGGVDFEPVGGMSPTPAETQDPVSMF